ncbi:HAD family hydrolase [Jatrophihabitans fulvus]
MPAILFGSISTISDTSELQRDAFNRAFQEHGLDWHWERDEYRDMLTGNGGKERISSFAERAGVQVDAAAVHETKSTLFQRSLQPGAVTPRAGVRDLVADAKAAGWKIGIVTTTARGNVDALLESLTSEAERQDFAVVIAREDVDSPKPDPEVYAKALAELGEPAEQVVAIEDNLGGVESARAAGLAVVAFPNENTALHDFGDTPRVARLSFAELAGLAGGADTGAAR